MTLYLFFVIITISEQETVYCTISELIKRQVTGKWNGNQKQSLDGSFITV